MSAEAMQAVRERRKAVGIIVATSEVSALLRDWYLGQMTLGVADHYDHLIQYGNDAMIEALANVRIKKAASLTHTLALMDEHKEGEAGVLAKLNHELALEQTRCRREGHEFIQQGAVVDATVAFAREYAIATRRRGIEILIRYYANGGETPALLLVNDGREL